MALALLGSIAFSGKAIIVKLAYRYGVDAVTLIMYRMLFALPIFAAMAWWASRGKPPLSRKDWLGVLGLGVTGYYLASFLDFAGLMYVTASLERLILYLNPTLVVVLGWALYGKRIRAGQALGMGISYCGVVLVFGLEAREQGAHAAWGALLIFLSAVSYAVYLVYSGEMVQRIGALRLVGLATTVACLCCLAQFVALRPLGAAIVAPEVLWLSVLNAILCTAAPVLMVMMAIERIGAGMAAQAGMVGPLSTILMGIWILGEPFTLWLAAGTALVMLGIFVFTRSARGRTLNAWGRALPSLSGCLRPSCWRHRLQRRHPRRCRCCPKSRWTGPVERAAVGCWRACAGRAMPEHPPCACWVQHAWQALAVHRRCCCLPHLHLRSGRPLREPGLLFHSPSPVCRPWWLVWWCWCRRARAHRPGCACCRCWHCCCPRALPSWPSPCRSCAPSQWRLGASAP